MIIGTGIDLIEIERIEEVYKKEYFRIRTFTPDEIALIGKHPVKAAGNFAVKEAVVKVFGTGFSACKPVDIEVLRDEHGKPYVNLYGKAKAKADELGITKLDVSISNTKNLVTAMAIGEA